MYEYENRNSELRQSMQHESAQSISLSSASLIEPLSEQPCYRAALLQRLSLGYEAHMRFCVALEPLLQSMVVV